MKNKDITVGHAYVAKVSGSLVLIRVVEKIALRSFTGRTKHTRFVCDNLRTMQRITCTGSRMTRRASEPEVLEYEATGGESWRSPVASLTPVEAQVRKERSCGSSQ